jgi:hypothetical protein
MPDKIRQSFRHFPNARILWLLMPAIICVWLCPVHAFSQVDDTESQLRARISGFWNAMQDGDYLKAGTFVLPDSYKAFDRTNRTRVVKWSIQRLEFNQDRTSCLAVMTVTKPAAALAVELDWPLYNQWVLSDGQWYFKMPWGENENPFFAIFKDQEKTSEDVKPMLEAAPAKRPPPSRSSSRDLAMALQRLVPDPENPHALHFGEKGRFRYSFNNTGTEPISVVAADTDCHCTSVNKGDSEVPPGKTGTIEIVLDTFGLPLGRIEKTITVQFSDLLYPLTILLKVDSLPNYKVTPSVLDFGSLVKGERAERILRLSNESGKKIRILSKMHSDPKLDLTIDRDFIEAGAEAAISVRYNGETPGEFLDNLMLQTDLPAESFVNISIKGIVKP